MLPRPDGGLEEQVQRCKARFENLKQKSKALREKSSKGSTEELKGEQAALKKELQGQQAALKKELKVLKKLAPAQGQAAGQRRGEIGSALGNLQKDFNDYEVVDTLVGKVEQGITALRNPPGSRSSAEDYFNGFLEYRKRQQHQQDDDGKDLVSVLEKAAEATESSAKGKNMTGFVCRFISHLVEHLRRRRDPTYSKTGNFDRDRHARRLDRVPALICRIVNGLRKYKGAEALVVLNALVGKSMRR